jgi:Fic family protein
VAREQTEKAGKLLDEIEKILADQAANSRQLEIAIKAQQDTTQLIKNGQRLLAQREAVEKAWRAALEAAAKAQAAWSKLSTEEAFKQRPPSTPGNR